MIVLPSLHPATLLKNVEDDAKGQARFERTVVGDFVRAKELTKRAPNWNEEVIHQKKDGRQWRIFPTVGEVIEFCQRAAQYGKTLTIDIESVGSNSFDTKLICVGLGFGKREQEDLICVPFLSSGGTPYWWNPKDEAVVRLWLGWLLKHPGIPKNFQNGAFDTVVLWRHNLQVFPFEFDTLLAHALVDGELPHGLDYLTSIYEEMQYYKGDVKGGDVAFIDLPDPLFRIYNLRDVLVTHRIMPKLHDEIDELELWPLYKQMVEQSKIMARSTVRGLLIDLERRDSTQPCSHVLDKKERCAICGELRPTRVLPQGLGPRMELYQGEALAVLRTLAGDPEFRPTPNQLRKLFYERLGFPVVNRTAKGLPALDKTAMVLLSLHADTRDRQAALKNLILWKRSDKILGTYVYGLPLGTDGRLHVAWKVFGAVTGRYSSSPNAQNWNYQVKRLFRASPGYKYASIDLSQAELRGMAYTANDEDLLEAYRLGLNVHTINATLLFLTKNPGADTNPGTEAYLAKACPERLGLPYEGMTTADPANWKEVRKLAKNFAFGNIYGAVADTLYQVLRDKLDPDTGEQMFPDITLTTVEALKKQFDSLHPAIVRYWSTITHSTQRAKHYRSAYSGRIRWFRGGFKRNEMINYPIQELVAAHMRRIIDIDHRLQNECPHAALVSQVHDATTIEAPEGEAEVCGRIMTEELSKPFALPGFPDAVLPPDEPTYGVYYSDV